MSENLRRLNGFNVGKTLALYGSLTDPHLVSAQVGKRLPDFSRTETGRKLKSWTTEDLPKLGEIFGFLFQPEKPAAISVFVTKGGVLKTTFTLNLARMAALHNIKTCVVGLDMQGDISTALGENAEIEDSDGLDSALEKASRSNGLAQVFSGDVSVKDCLKATDLPTLWYIPETPELVALDQSLIHRNRREYWLKEKVVQPLLSEFQLVIMDCSPSWNRLITNALVASDFLISPLECKINNFRNLQTFRNLLDEFRTDFDLELTQFWVPTKLATGRRLSREIFDWYRANISSCSVGAIRESIQGEEASALRLSIPEYAPQSVAADEMRALLGELWGQMWPNQARRFQTRASFDMVTADSVPTKEAPSQSRKEKPSWR